MREKHWQGIIEVIPVKPIICESFKNTECGVVPCMTENKFELVIHPDGETKRSGDKLCMHYKNQDRKGIPSWEAVRLLREEKHRIKESSRNMIISINRALSYLKERQKREAKQRRADFLKRKLKNL